MKIFCLSYTKTAKIETDLKSTTLTAIPVALWQPKIQILFYNIDIVRVVARRIWKFIEKLQIVQLAMISWD